MKKLSDYFKVTEEDKVEYYNRGKEDYTKHIFPDVHGYMIFSILYNDWLRGWEDAQKEELAKMKCVNCGESDQIECFWGDQAAEVGYAYAYAPYGPYWMCHRCQINLDENGNIIKE